MDEQRTDPTVDGDIRPECPTEEDIAPDVSPRGNPRKEFDLEEPLVEKIARVAHEANRGYCQSIGDYSQLPWDEVFVWQRESTIVGVTSLMGDPDQDPAKMHESWMRHKQADGWVYGPVKKGDVKQHPCLVPYSELPQEQKTKDYIFRSVVLGMLK